MLNLFPMIYSKHKTVEQITKALAEAPEQKPNSKEVFKGLVMEFRTEGDPRPGTLTEIEQFLGYKAQTGYCIVAKNGKVKVETNNEKFIVKS